MTDTYRPATHGKQFTGSPGGRPKARCTEIIARTPQVLLERSDTPQDYTHLQHCGGPVKRNGKCAKHLKQPNTRLGINWRRFITRGG